MQFDPPYAAPDLPVGYVRRVQELGRIRNAVLRNAKTTAVTALVGMGGAGRSNLASGTCIEVHGRFDRILWFQLDNPQQPIPPIDEFGLREKRCLVVARYVQSHEQMRALLSIRPTSLLIIPADISLIPDGATVVEIGPMTWEEGVSLLSHGLDPTTAKTHREGLSRIYYDREGFAGWLGQANQYIRRLVVKDDPNATLKPCSLDVAIRMTLVHRVQPIETPGIEWKSKHFFSQFQD